MPTKPKPLLTFAVALSSILLVSAIGLWSMSRRGEIIIGSKNFTESRLLAEIMAQVIEREAGLTVERKELGSTTLCWGALGTGAIHVYPEYTGTLLSDILKQKPLADPATALAKIREIMPAGGLIEVADPFGLNDTYVLAMRSKESKLLGISHI
jgi:glycine betaine/choline ABC-type transport system substrate-binding protein